MQKTASNRRPSGLPRARLGLVLPTCLRRASLQALAVDDRYSAEEVLIHPWITGAAHVDPEYEELAAIAVQSQLRSNADPDEEPMCSYLGDDDNVEYYYSRRRSMDDLSVPASQHEEDSDGDGDVSFEYLENVHNAVDESVARTAQ
uniref:Uncharacterized protein n=1 Tax=Plectus sambesii TaxID=2011161 RepID=A0A914XLJ3_9BILA